MQRTIRVASALVAVSLIPCLLYVGLVNATQTQQSSFALWAPIGVLVADAVIFYIVLGMWSLTRWERAGLSIILPLLIATASWAAMMGMVSAQMPQGG